MWTALLKAIPTLISLANKIFGFIVSQRDRALGHAEEKAEALQQQKDDLAKVQGAKVEADAAHAKHDDDSAFDQEFKRD